MATEPREPGGDSPAAGADDVSWVQRIASGNHAGIALLYDRHGRAIHSLACRMLSDAGEAEDVVQEVFSQAWRQAGRFDPSRSSVRGWLLMMTRARSIDRIRARNVRPALSVSGDDNGPPVADAGPSPEAAALTGQDARRVQDALAALEPAQRRALELAYYSGLTQTEIAAALSEPLGTVKTRVRSALSRLRAALESGR